MTQPRPRFVRIDRRAANDIAQRLADLGDDGIAGGIDGGFDIDAFIAETAAPPSATHDA